MITGRLRWLGLVAGSLLTLGGLSGCEMAQLTLGTLDLERYDALETLTQEIPYGGQRIVVDSMLGKVVVRGQGEPGYVAWRPFLQVTAVKKVRGLDLEDLRVSFTQSEEEIRVQAEVPPEIGRRLRLLPLPPRIEDRVGWVELTLSVPPGASLVIDQQAGVLEIEGVKGELSASVQLGEIVVRDSEFSLLVLRSEAGELRVQGVSSQRLEARSEMGPILLKGVVFTQAALTSELGDIAVEDSRGDALQASAQMGGLEVRGSRLEDVRLESQMGSIALASTELGGGWVSTQMGSIRIALSAGEPLRIRAETQMGKIRLRGTEAVPTAAARWEFAWPGQSLTLSFGEERELDERRTLHLSTQLGSIEIVLVP